MFYYFLSSLFFGAICSAKSLHPKHNGHTVFHTQGENRTESLDDETNKYLQHTYYKVDYAPLTNWASIAKTGNVSKMSGRDDPPPFELISIKEQGWVFPFYGHAHPVIYIDCNGFLSMVPRYCPHFGFCNWQEPEGHHDSQYQRYIAPMMTDFNPSRFKDSNITYAFSKVNGMPQLVVQWSNVVLFSFRSAKVKSGQDGFTFQVVLQKNGDITFNYRKLPYYPGNRTLKDNHGPAKKYPIVMGVEDAVIVKRGNKNVLADYNPLNIKESVLFDMYAKHGGVSIKMKALPTCTQFKTCYDCSNYTLMTKNLPNRLKCGWCESNKICADVMGRESSSLSAGCLANKLMLNTKQQCDNIGKVVKVNRTWLHILIVIVVLGLLLMCCLCYKMKRMNKELQAYSKGLPSDAAEADRATHVVGQRDHKEEMSA